MGRFSAAIWTPVALTAFLTSSCATPDASATIAAAEAAAQSTAPAMPVENEDPDDWAMHGRTNNEQRFSPLDQINDANVDQLGLAWHYDLDTDRGQESTPLEINGVLYVTSAWSKVFALDARTGEELWVFDPKVDKSWLVNACCGPVNRGAAASDGKIFVGTLDGRLIALDAKTGAQLWSTKTFEGHMPYAITGAPRVVKGKVLIGNGGAELGARGYISAYDEQTGRLVWRFHTVPGNPADGFENATMEMAAKTWHGEWWKQGGGGTVWDAIVYDPRTDLVYIGVGNGSPWARSLRSPGGGDNLFLGSIVALDPDTGEYVWHYQETPGDSWDFTSTQPMMTADLPIGGKLRHVILHAPKNGFFYILDAASGELLSAKPYSQVDWATHVDMATGRPVETPQARYDETGKPFVGLPGANGAHNWFPWSFNPNTGLVYIPFQQVPYIYRLEPGFAAKPKALNAGIDLGVFELPDDPVKATQGLSALQGALMAWDPVAQKVRWRVNHAGPWNGGTLSTAGNLVVQGLATGQLTIYRADTGEQLWSFDAQTGIIAGAISYAVDGEQYLAVTVGWGGGQQMLVPGTVARALGYAQQNISRVLVFKLGGTDSLPPIRPRTMRTLQAEPETGTTESIEQGHRLYLRHCASCHGLGGVGGSLIPDLRRSSFLHNGGWFSVVLNGAFSVNGMAAFGDVLSRQEATDIRNYIIKRANVGIAVENGEVPKDSGDRDDDLPVVAAPQ